MKNFILINIILLGFISEISSQQGWFTLHTYQGTSSYTGLKFFDSQTGYLTSRFGNAHINGGITQKTTNGGLNWFTVLSGVPEDGLFFINVNTGWVYGGYWDDAGERSREIFWTTNGGANFIRVYLDSLTNAFSKMFFADVNTGYLLSTDTSIYKSTNSGYNWSVCATISLFSIYFINANTGWGSAALGNVYKTTNGGMNWSSYNVGTSIALRNVIFRDYNTGWVNSSSHIFKTTNSGINWAAYSLGFSGAYKMEFYDYNKGWLTKDSGKVAYTSNGGINWMIQNGGVIHNLSFISFANSSTGFVAGWRMVSPYPATGEVILMKTTTGGLTPVEHLSNNIPKDFSLSQNYPNPFNPSTTIEFDIPASCVASLTIYDVTGRKVESLVNELVSSPGRYRVLWNAANYSSGIYFYTIKTESFQQTKRMVFVK
ncbi:MAG: T9SS C-terminal target domain-containing protein [Ignavibacteriae bacterium]|nr:MAG: T9SS C-terminal target domain-containing protein [Ignavibacteriota bacterium]